MKSRDKGTRQLREISIGGERSFLVPDECDRYDVGGKSRPLPPNQIEADNLISHMFNALAALFVGSQVDPRHRN